MFRLFGFDVAVRPGFVVFCGLIVLLYQDAFGLWLAGSLAGFTLLHELGHALAARSAGADAAISLDFMAGYTSFSARRPIGAARRVLISASGPLIQIGASLAVLTAMGVNAFDIDSVRGSDAAAAIWWAGPAVGVLNLIPVLPLDGGHIAQTGLETVLRRPALREMAIASLAITVGGAVAMAIFSEVNFVIFIAFLVIGQVQLLQATSPKSAARVRASATWNADAVHLSASGMRPSPWQRAHAAIVAGDPDLAERLILDDLTSPSGGRGWAPPAQAPMESLRAVTDVLPHTLPPGNAYSETVLVQVLYAVGEVKRAGELAAAAFARHRTPLLATVVARAAARMGDPVNARQWVDAAREAMVDATPGEQAAALHVLEHAPELTALRT